MQTVDELQRTQINVVKSKGILKAPSAVAIRQLTTVPSLGLGKNRRTRRKTLEARKRSTTLLT